MFVDDYIIPVTPRHKDNGHKIAGEVRDAARMTADAVCSATGRRKYEVSPGGYGLNDNHGVHQHVAPGDLWSSPFDDKVDREGDLIVCIDTDYYITNFDRLLSSGAPGLFFTFEPTKVSGNDGECYYRIKDNKVIYEVSGGGRWEHEIWDWAGFGEYFYVDEVSRYASRTRLFARLFGFRGRVIYKRVFYRPWPQCPERILVLLLPQYRVVTRSTLDLRGPGLTCPKLKRAIYTHPDKPDWNAIVSVGDDKELQVSYGPAGEDASAVLPKTHFDAVAALENPQSVTSRMMGLDHKDPLDLAITTQFHTGKPRPSQPVLRLGRPAQPVQVHWPLAAQYDAPVVNWRDIGPALVEEPAMVPAIKRWEALSRSIDERVTFVRNDTIPPKRFFNLANEFVALAVPAPNTGVPLDLEETIKRLNKPSQILAIRSIIETIDMPPRQLIEAFVKNEPTTKNGRIISSFPDVRYLVGFSQYSLSFRDAVLDDKDITPWFMPGQNPNQIAREVVKYVSSVPEPVEYDFTNYDGSTPKFIQVHVTNAVYLRYFMRDYHSSLRQFLDQQISCPARAKRFGFRYEAGCGVKSGSPITCDGNSLGNAYTHYCAIRLADPDMPIDQAYRMIGPIFGDDSIGDVRYRKSWEHVCKSLGFRVKSEAYDASKGLTFLSRVYIDPYGSTTTFQDPLRTLMKLHLTSRNQTVPLADAATDRAEGYLAIDRMTPIVSTYCKLVVEHYSSEVSSRAIRERRADKHRDKPYWLYSGGAWPQNPRDRCRMEEVFAARMGVDVEYVRDYDAYLANVKSLVDVRPLQHSAFKGYTDTLGPDGLPTAEPVDHATLRDAYNRIVDRASGQRGGRDHHVKRPVPGNGAHPPPGAGPNPGAGAGLAQLPGGAGGIARAHAQQRGKPPQQADLGRAAKGASVAVNPVGDKQGPVPRSPRPDPTVRALGNNAGAADDRADAKGNGCPRSQSARPPARRESIASSNASADKQHAQRRPRGRGRGRGRSDHRADPAPQPAGGVGSKGKCDAPKAGQPVTGHDGGAGSKPPGGGSK